MKYATNRFIQYYWLLLLLLSLNGCYAISAGTLGLLDAIDDKCSIHPVLIAAGRDGGYDCPQPPNFGITPDNANDTPQGYCVIELAVATSYRMFVAALEAGSDPARCHRFDSTDALIMVWLGSRSCNDPRYIQKFEELGIEPLVPPSEMLGKGFMRCSTAMEYAVSKGADPNAPIQRKTYQTRPLEIAVGSGTPSNYQAVRTLIKLGADPYLPTMQTGEPIYDYAKAKWTAPEKGKIGKEVWPKMEKALLGK